MSKLVCVLKSAYVSFIIGYILTVALSNWTWLDMRLSVSNSLPISVLIGGLLPRLLPGSFKRPFLGKWTVLSAQGVLLFIMLVSYSGQLDAFLVLPAVALREGFKLSLSLQQINSLLLVIWLLGNVLWFVIPRQQEE